jgi:hypothetical protein
VVVEQEDHPVFLRPPSGGPIRLGDFWTDNQAYLKAKSRIPESLWLPNRALSGPAIGEAFPE